MFDKKEAKERQTEIEADKERERESEREKEANIDRARDRKESEDARSSVQLGYKVFPVSICALTPSSKGFVLIWHVCLCICRIFYLSQFNNGGRFGGTQSAVDDVTEADESDVPVNSENMLNLLSWLLKSLLPTLS